MSYFLLCGIIFLLAYTLNMLYVSVFYHRALAHGAVTLSPWLKTFVVRTGGWVTGIDPKAWVCMHRMHHAYSDTEKDPHTPVVNGIWSVFGRQLLSYKRIMAGLMFNKNEYVAHVRDLNFSVSWVNKSQLWYLPYLLHLVLAVFVGIVFNAWALAICYWLGMMSHPVQGWMVNALAHKYGYRNFETPDQSKNNSIVAWLVFGEGYQNNHHHAPSAARFSVKSSEVDLGYGLCRLLGALRLIQIH